MSETDASRVRAHLDTCSACQRLDATLIADHEDFVRQLRGLTVSEAPQAVQVGARSGVPATLTKTKGASTTSAPETSTVAIEGYEIYREIHRGGQGVVYEAFQQSMKRKVAIKVLLGGAFSSDAARRRFEREIELVASPKHPNIIAVHDSGVTSDNQPYCVMDYIEGQRLDEHVRATQLTLEEVLTLFKNICDAVMYAHQRGVIHRDLKPSNIMVDTEGSPKVLDFGLAKQVAGPPRFGDRGYRRYATLHVTGAVAGGDR